MPDPVNLHMWIPYQGSEPYDEVCGLCGAFSGAHRGHVDPPAANLPCPEPWPTTTPLTQGEMDEIERITDELGSGPVLIQLSGAVKQ